MGDPLCRGIFGGDARKLSLRSCFPVLDEYERNHGAVIRGMLFSRKRMFIDLFTRLNVRNR